ncbi:hypothetical protein P8452_52389 [Trifolium repens]|nr:hypothetical protein P8452_52389 [Trifolium repens]
MDNDVELYALGTDSESVGVLAYFTIPTVIIMAEILKRNGWAIEKSVMPSTIGTKEDKDGCVIPKAKVWTSFIFL